MRLNHLKHVPYIEQMRQTECGLCCVAMILQYYKSYDGIKNIRKDLDVGRDGLKLSVLSQYLKSRGMDTKIFKCPSHLLSNFQLPAILFWNKEHFVVLEKIEKNTYYVVDPAFGRLKLKKEKFDEHFSNIIMVSTPTEKFVPHKKTSHLWIDSFRNLKINKRIALGIFISYIIGYLFQLAIPLLIENIIDSAESTSFARLYGTYFPLVLVSSLFFGLFNFYRGQKTLSMEVDIDNYLTKGVFHKLLHLPYKFFESRSNGDLLFRMNCLTSIRDLISEQILQGIIQIGMVGIILFYMLNKSVLLTSISLLFLCANIFFITKMKAKLAEVNQYALRANTSMQSIQVETVYSMFGVKIAGMEQEILKNWDEKYEESLKMHKKKCVLQNINDTVIGLLQLAGPVVLLIAGIYCFRHTSISVGEIIAVYSLSGTLFSSASQLFSIWTDFTLASSYLERVSDIMEAEEENEPKDAMPLSVSGNINIEHLSFSYNKHTDMILKDISMQINPGQKIAIVGTSGSGKSTLSKLLLGLYEANKGNILFDQIDLSQLNKHNIRRQIGVVPQDMTLFNKTIFDNIAVNKSDISLEDVKHAAQVAQLDNEIEAMPMQYDTLVSDMGMNLSGGQRQRIALARALVSNPKILILDEATSALDYVNEHKVSNYLKEANCTRIVIAHRLSTIVDADKIIVLDDGCIKECGTHEELLSNPNGIYHKLYECQNAPVAV